MEKLFKLRREQAKKVREEFRPWGFWSYGEQQRYFEGPAIGFGVVRAMAFLLERPAIGERREYNRYGREEREI